MIDYYKIKKGDYIVLEFGKWEDKLGIIHNTGICYGHVKKYEPNFFDQENEEKYPVFICDKVIYADKELSFDGMLYVTCGNKFRYMTEKEIEEFNNKFS